MYNTSCLNGENCLQATYNFFSLSKVGFAVSLVVEFATLIIGILAITKILPGISITHSAIILGSGGFSFALTIVLVCLCYYANEKKTSFEYRLTHSSDKSQTSRKTEPEIVEQTVLNPEISTSLTLGKWLCGLAVFDGPDKARTMHTKAYNLSADLLLHSRKEGVLFNKKGIVGKLGSKTPIDFAYTPLLELKGEGFDEKSLRDILASFIEEIKRKTIPKLFISTAAEPKNGIPHALLLVIEPQPQDFTHARITLIDSFGSNTGYRAFKKKLEKISCQSFPSPNTTFVHNPVLQQMNGWSCGWHMLANVELLSKQPNVQEFVINKCLPKPNIERFRRRVYEQYVVPASKQWNQAVPEDNRRSMLHKQFQKKNLSGDCKEWCEELIEKGFQLEATL